MDDVGTGRKRDKQCGDSDVGRRLNLRQRQRSKRRGRMAQAWRRDEITLLRCTRQNLIKSKDRENKNNIYPKARILLIPRKKDVISNINDGSSVEIDKICDWRRCCSIRR